MIVAIISLKYLHRALNVMTIYPAILSKIMAFGRVIAM